jgi:hypothetical protein
MTSAEIFYAALIIISLGVLRFGVPLALTMLLKKGCCSILKLEA